MKFKLTLLIASLCCFANSVLSLEDSSIAEVLDIPEWDFTLETYNAVVAADTETFAKGTSSLSATSVYQASDDAHWLNFKLTAPIPGPGRLSFRVRAKNFQPNHFTVNGTESDKKVSLDSVEDTWYEVMYYLYGPSQLQLRLSTFRKSEDFTYYFDDFVFEPGVELRIDDIPEAGKIVLNPQKDLYQVGEEVEVSVQSVPGITVESITSRTIFSANDTVHPPSFTFTAAQNIIFKPGYIQSLTLSGFDARIRLLDEVVASQDPASFTARSVEIFNLPKNTLLSFGAQSSQYRDLAAEGTSSSVYVNRLGFEAFDPALQRTHIRMLVDKPETAIEINPSTDWNPGYPHSLTFHNFSLSTETTLDILTRGKGTVTAEYAPGPTPGSRAATLNAIPDAGWKFLEWRGAAASSEATQTILIDHPDVIVAEFAQVFDFGNSKWAFIHDGSRSIRLTDDQKGIRFEESEAGSALELTLKIFGQGPFSATRINFNSEGEQIYASDLFPYPIEVGRAPVSKRTSLYISQDPSEIRDIVVSGGNGYDDIPFKVNAPVASSSIDPQSEEYHHRDMISLSVNEPWQDRFLGWFGDYYSPEQQIDVLLERPLQLQAVFGNAMTTSDNRSIKTKGTVFLEATSNQGELNFSPKTFSPGDWEEIEIEATPPLTVAFKFSGESESLHMQFSTPSGDLAESQVTRHTDGATYCTLPEGSAGPLRAKFSNTNDHAINGQISIQGFYRNTDDWVDSRSTYRVKLAPEERYVPLGSSVKVDAIPYNENIPFNSWIGRSESEASFEIIAKEGESVSLNPSFKSILPIDGVTDISAYDSNWSRTDGPTFQNNSSYTENEIRTISLQVQGPGVLEFHVNHDYPQYVSVEVLIDGETARTAVSNNQAAYQRKILVETGIKQIDIKTQQSPAGIEAAEQPGYGRIEIIGFTPGFYVGGSDPIQYTVLNGKPYSPPIFEPDTSLRISPEDWDDIVFNAWKGDLTGNPKVATVTVDRHIIAEYSQNQNRSLGPIGIELSENAIFHTAGAAEYYIESESGPTTMTFTVPRMTEFGFSLRYAETPTTVKVDGEIVYQGEESDKSLAFPVKLESQTIELSFDLDPKSDRQLWVNNLFYLTQFELYGDFGDKQDIVVAEPSKDTYQPGEKVTVKLTSGAASDWVFYDVGVSLPTLGLFEWNESARGKRSFEVEIASQTELIGKVGPLPNRAAGDFTSSETLNLRASSTQAPDGSTAQAGSFIDSAYFKVYSPGARSVAFWAKIPPEQTWTFPDAGLAINGTGEWQKLIIPIADGSNYFWATQSLSLTSANTFWISTPQTISGYAPPLIGAPFSDYRLIPGNGVLSQSESLRIEAQPDDGYSFKNWNLAPERNNPNLTLRKDEFYLLEPQIVKNPVYLQMPGARIEILNDGLLAYPEFNSISFENNGSAIRLEVEGPGRVLYVSKHQDGNGELHVTLDGKPLYLHKRYSYDPAAPELKVPQGHHTLEWTYSEKTLADNYLVTNLLFEAGSYLEIPNFLQNGSVSVNPDKRFFPKGETVTLTASPNLNYALRNWGGDWQDEQRSSPLTTTLTDHLSINPKFVYETSTPDGASTWHIVQDVDNYELFSATTSVSGPGYFTVPDPMLATPRMDGLETETKETEFGPVVTVPPGRHQLEFFTHNIDISSVYWTLAYNPGLLFALTEPNGHVEIAPRQQSYLPGSQVTLSLPPQSNTEYLDGEQLNPGESRTYEIWDHTLVSNNNLREIGFGFSTDALPSDIDMDVRKGSIAQFRLGSYRSAYPFISKTYQQAGILETTLEHLSDQTLEVYVNGISVHTISENGTYTIQLPPKEITVVWKANSRNSASQPVIVNSIQFTPIELDPTTQAIALMVPAHLYASQSSLFGPLKDFDGDGRSNKQELLEHTPIHLFDLPIRITPKNGSAPTVSLNLPSDLDLSRLYLMWLKQENNLSVWQKMKLDELSPESAINSNTLTLSFELPPSLISKLVRVCILPSNLLHP